MITINEALPDEMRIVESAVSGVSDEIIVAVEETSPSSIETTPVLLGIDGMGTTFFGMDDKIVATV